MFPDSGFRSQLSLLLQNKNNLLLVKSGKIVKVDVTSGNESGHSVEVFGNLTKGDSVITDANDEIREGVY